jgi:hypothetical protein
MFVAGRNQLANKGVAQFRGRFRLGAMQRAQFDASKSFDVVGCDSGRRYRIFHGRVTNVHEIDDAGLPVTGWCFAPSGYLVAGDDHACPKNRARDEGASHVGGG